MVGVYNLSALEIQCREVGKAGRDVFTAAYRLTVLPAKKIRAINAMPGSREDGKRRFYRCLPFYRKKYRAINAMPGSREDGKRRFTAPYRLTVLPAKKIPCYKCNAGKSGRREETFFPNLTALPFYRQKKYRAINTMPGSREDGKMRSSRTLPPYRFTGKKIPCYKYKAGKSGKREGTFFRFFTTNSAWRGTRLGLSLAYDIIKAHGGKSLYLQQKV